MYSSEMKNSHLVLSPQEQWVLREHNVEAPGPTSTTQQEAESKRIHEIIASRKIL